MVGGIWNKITEVEVAHRLTTTMIQLLKMVMPLLTFELLLNCFLIVLEGYASCYFGW